MADSLPTLIAQWQEPSPPNRRTMSPVAIIGGSAGVAALLVAIGLWQHDLTFYLAAAVAGGAGGSLYMQQRKPAEPLQISILSDEIQVGVRHYPLADLAGFWIQHDGDLLVINLEGNRPAMVPVTLLFANSDTREARATLLEVLPELEARQETVADRLNRYIRL